MKFTSTEKGIIGLYGAKTRKGMIAIVENVIAYTEEQEVLECGKSILGKLQSMTDEEYENADLTSDFDADAE